MKTLQEISISIHCYHLPGSRFEDRTSVRLGIQKGQAIIDDVPADTPQITFIVPLRVDRNTETGKPNFLAPLAHGTPQERFIYLCWGEWQNDKWDGFRRAKVHLKHLTWEQIEVALQNNQAVEFSFDMTDAKGGPVCGSLNLHNQAK